MQPLTPFEREDAEIYKQLFSNNTITMEQTITATKWAAPSINFDFIRKFISRQREALAAKRVAAIRDEYRVTERDGRLWITHLGCAIGVIAPDTKARDVAAYLNQIRDISVEYERISTQIDA